MLDDHGAVQLKHRSTGVFTITIITAVHVQGIKINENLKQNYTKLEVGQCPT